MNIFQNKARTRKLTLDGAIVTTSVLVAVYPAVGNAAEQSIVQNGSFEQVLYVPLRIPPWDPVRWGALLGNWGNAPDGVNYIFVDAIYQDLHTTFGQQYTLSFNVAADLFSEPSAQVSVFWGGQSLATFVTQPHGYNPEVNRYEQIVWESFSLPLTANDLTTRLEFQSANGVSYLFDNVRVEVVPEPSVVSLCLAAGLALVARARNRTANIRRNVDNPERSAGLFAFTGLNDAAAQGSETDSIPQAEQIDQAERETSHPLPRP